MKNKHFNKRSALVWMKNNAEDYRDDYTQELNLTRIVEACCAHFGVDAIGGPLDDPDHWIWELPIIYLS